MKKILFRTLLVALLAASQFAFGIDSAQLPENQAHQAGAVYGSQRSPQE